MRQRTLTVLDTFNSLLLGSGCNPLLVREYLGWSEQGDALTTVQRGYTHFQVMDMQGLMKVIDDVFEGLAEGQKAGKVVDFRKADAG